MARSPPRAPTVPNTPVSGGVAQDDTGQHDSTCKAVLLQQPPPSPLPPDSPAAPGALGLEAPGSFKDPNRNLTTVDFNRTSYLAITYDDGGRKLNMYVYTAGIDLDSGVAHPLSDVAVSA